MEGIPCELQVSPKEARPLIYLVDNEGKLKQVTLRLAEGCGMLCCGGCICIYDLVEGGREVDQCLCAHNTIHRLGHFLY